MPAILASAGVAFLVVAAVNVTAAVFLVAAAAFLVVAVAAVVATAAFLAVVVVAAVAAAFLAVTATLRWLRRFLLPWLGLRRRHFRLSLLRLHRGGY